MSVYICYVTFVTLLLVKIIITKNVYIKSKHGYDWLISRNTESILMTSKPAACVYNIWNINIHLVKQNIGIVPGVPTHNLNHLNELITMYRYILHLEFLS